MIDHLNLTPYDPKRLVRLVATRPLFIKARSYAVGETFEVEAREAGGILATLRADFADQADRPLVYRKVMLFS